MPLSTNFGSDKIPRGFRVDIWGGVSIPAANARITITSGQPDATENASAVHLGRTTDGAELGAGGGLTPRKSDDYSAPYDYVRGDDEMMSIKANILRAFDFAVRALLTNHATHSAASGYDQLTYGGKQGAIVANGFVAIVRLPEASPAKYYVFHIYQGVNNAPFSGRFKRAGDPTSFAIDIQAVQVVTRAEGDQLGNEWQQA